MSCASCRRTSCSRQEFLEVFDGFSIGSNDLTQLVLGIDRDSGTVAHLFDERNEAVMGMIAAAINAAQSCTQTDRYLRPGAVRLSGVRDWLVGRRIHSISLNPDVGDQDSADCCEGRGRRGNYDEVCIVRCALRRFARDYVLTFVRGRK